MAEPRVPDPVLLVVAAFSRHPSALIWARENLELAYGPVVLTSPFFDFHQTRYYEPEMGFDLKKQFLAFTRLVPADILPEVKRHTNELEASLALSHSFAEARPLNLDPGILSLGKFMLATTKDQAHRIYLREGIYAEVTLQFQSHAYHANPWTYADYREQPLLDFLREARDYYRQRLREEMKMDD